MLHHCCELVKGNCPELLRLCPQADISTYLVSGTTISVMFCAQMRAKSTILSAHYWHVGYAIKYADGIVNSPIGLRFDCRQIFLN